jgi:prepilin-type N-terminal cleavage/methylation domain-containing protein
VPFGLVSAELIRCEPDLQPDQPLASEQPVATRRGLTLIELMLVVTIMGLMMGIVAPRFSYMRVRWLVESASQQLVRDLNHARTEAVKRNDMVWLAKTGGSGYAMRYIGTRALPGGVTFTAGPDTVKFAAFGPAITGAATFQLTLGDVARSVTVSASGFANAH